MEQGETRFINGNLYYWNVSDSKWHPLPMRVAVGGGGRKTTIIQQTEEMKNSIFDLPTDLIPPFIPNWFVDLTEPTFTSSNYFPLFGGEITSPDILAKVVDDEVFLKEIDFQFLASNIGIGDTTDLKFTLAVVFISDANGNFSKAYHLSDTNLITIPYTTPLDATSSKLMSVKSLITLQSSPIGQENATDKQLLVPFRDVNGVKTGNRYYVYGYYPDTIKSDIPHIFFDYTIIGGPIFGVNVNIRNAVPIVPAIGQTIFGITTSVVPSSATTGTIGTALRSFPGGFSPVPSSAYYKVGDIITNGFGPSITTVRIEAIRSICTSKKASVVGRVKA